MESPGNGSNSILIYEQTCKAAAEAYAKDPFDAENLTKWGRALSELSTFQDDEESISMLSDAISKFEEALQIDPSKAHALWLLGNCHLSYGFWFPDLTKAQVHFDKANSCFEQAVELEPSNELYNNSLQMRPGVLEAHIELHGEQIIGGGTPPLPNAK